MADPNLTESAWQRAQEDAARVIKSPHFGIGAAIVGLIFAAGALVASESQPVTTQVGATILFGALSIAVTLLFIFLAQLAAAPVRQRNELRQAWEPPSDPVRPINIELALRNERRKASGFYRVRGNGTITRTKEDEQGAEEWTNRVVDLLTEHVGSEAAREFIEAPRNVEQFKPRLDAQTRALDQIIDRLGEG